MTRGCRNSARHPPCRRPSLSFPFGRPIGVTTPGTYAIARSDAAVGDPVTCGRLSEMMSARRSLTSCQPRLAVLVCCVAGGGPLNSFFSPLRPSDSLGQLHENSFLAQ